MDYKIALLLIAAVISSGCLSAISGSQPEDEKASQEKSSKPSTNSEAGNNTIIYTGSGFQPADLTIQKGETVTWINEASTSMWIASNRHPTHTEYSGTTRTQHCQNGEQKSSAFDQCSTGNKFSFSFEKTGEWSYHNHQPFVPGGTITVTR